MRQLAFGHNGDINLWCEDVGYTETGGLVFWVINGHWQGVYQNGRIECGGRSWPVTLLWRGHTHYSHEDYNEAMEWLREHLNRRPELRAFFERVKFMKKKTFADARSELEAGKHNERVEALASRAITCDEAIAKQEVRLAAMKIYRDEIITAGDNPDALSDADFAKLMNRQPDGTPSMDFANMSATDRLTLAERMKHRRS